MTPPFPSDHEVPGVVLLGPQGFYNLAVSLYGSAILSQAPLQAHYAAVT
jgi:hypothetical protein